MKRSIQLCFVLLLSLPAFAEEYPNMVGLWTGDVRTMSSGQAVSGQVARGGAVISEVKIKLTIDHQDNEVFIGSSRNSATPKDQRSTPIWGAIRSDGTEGIFVAGTGGRGKIWFVEGSKFEFCLTGLADNVISAYCGILEKEAK